MAHSHQHSSQSTRNIRLAFFLNLVFTVFEIIGGLWTNSLAILSDAIHDLGDSFSLGLSWYLDKYSNRERDAKFTYGYRRFSLLAALINTLVLLTGSALIIKEAIPRIFNPEPSHAQGMILFAIVGIMVNGFAVLRLRGGKSQNTRVIALHLLEDVLGWTAILIVAIVLLFADLYVLDPLLSIVITLYVLFNVFKNLKATSFLFMQGVPDSIRIEQLEQEITELPHVVSTHHTHIWSLDGEHHVLTTHVVVEPMTERDQVLEIKKEIHNMVSTLDIIHTTIEIEFSDQACLLDEQFYHQDSG